MKPIQTSTPTFRDIIDGGFLYIDKTSYIYHTVSTAKGIYFLSRPRRFGKSLLISTLEELFQGNKELFQDLWLYDSDYNWYEYPIIRLDFNVEAVETAEELEDMLCEYLKEIAEEHDIALENAPPHRMFRKLIQELSKQSQHRNQVVILIDEYDKPIIDNLDNLEEVKQIQKVLKAFYGVIKALDRYIRFVFITGISKFSRVSIFSDLNHLHDLTMDGRFDTLLGITQTELDTYFEEYLQHFAQKERMSVDDLVEKIRYWYNGFRFTRNETYVYNPFALMHLFNRFSFHNFWFESATPTFLVKLLQSHDYDLSLLHGTKIPELAFSTYNVENLSVNPILYQTGYLTIKDYDPIEEEYTLAYPNKEVEEAFHLWLLAGYSTRALDTSALYVSQLINALRVGDLKLMFKVLGTFFANIPYDLHVKHEKYYQTIFYLLFMMMGYKVQAEVQTNDGRIDAVVELTNHIYLFEFKLDKGVDKAITQIEEHKYYQKYQLRGKPITCVGANFNTTKRTVDEWDTL